MVESQIPAVSKFFFLVSNNSQKSHEAIYRTIMRLNKIYKKNPEKEEDLSLVVYWTHYYWRKIFLSKNHFSLESIFFKIKDFAKKENKYHLPEKIDMSIWYQFVREAKDEEVPLLIWSKVMSISDVDIARGIGISDGTVRLRIANALKKIGKIVVK